MATELSENKLMQALNWIYDQAVHGRAGFDSAEDMANDYLKGSGSLYDKANSLIRWQNTKAAALGFLTGFGGVVTLPISIPANVASVMYIQIRMIAAIAKMGGYDLKDDKVRALVIVCLAGDAATNVLKEVGITVGSKIANNAIKNISAQTLRAINQKAGFRLITQFGEKGAINLGKAVPIIGGLINGTVDLTVTNIIGNVARNTFIGVK